MSSFSLNVRVVVTCSGLSRLPSSAPSTPDLSLRCPTIYLLVFLFLLGNSFYSFFSSSDPSPFPQLLLEVEGIEEKRSDYKF